MSNRKLKRPTPKEICKVIEALYYSWKDGEKSIGNAQWTLDAIYCMTHLTSNCKCKHDKWVEQFYKVKNMLIIREKI